jgi:excisionase family DNA binding protein
VTTDEAADLLGISPRAVRHLIKVGTLPAVKRGRDWWITPAAVQAAQQRPGPGRPIEQKGKHPR